MKKALYSQFIFQLILACSIYSQVNFEENNSTKIFIKPSDRKIDSRVVTITPYGIILENNETVSYKVISKIVTDNESLLDTILHYVSHAIKSVDGKYFLLEMKQATFEKLLLSDDRIFQDQVFMFNILSSRAENIELAFNLSPRILENVYFQMSYTNGKYVNSKSYSLSAISVGFGRKIKLSTGEILFGINTGTKSLTVSSKKFMSPPLYSTVGQSVTYLEILYRSDLTNNWINFCLGSKYYFSNIKVLDVLTDFNISAGLVINLGAI
ncbi:MAG: hypothetical protein M0Q21_11970 [Ignavibacteriaceae bacterium]|nr:hypothetical protein [Ignavibacteriaceae bacterium]